MFGHPITSFGELGNVKFAVGLGDVKHLFQCK